MQNEINVTPYDNDALLLLDDSAIVCDEWSLLVIDFPRTRRCEHAHDDRGEVGDHVRLDVTAQRR
jgi:hypothetical protein